jgi:hypothetical protein
MIALRDFMLVPFLPPETQAAVFGFVLCLEPSETAKRLSLAVRWLNYRRTIVTAPELTTGNYPHVVPEPGLAGIRFNVWVGELVAWNLGSRNGALWTTGFAM